MKKRIFLVLFSIIAVLAIISCEATTGGGGSTGGGKTDPSNQNFLNGTTWKENYIPEDPEEKEFIKILSFTQTTFNMKFYDNINNDFFAHATGTYVYDAGEKKVTITITELIKHPQNKTIDNLTENEKTETYKIIEDGAKMIYPNSDGNNYFVKQ